MSLLRLLGAAFMFIVIRQFLKLIINLGQRRMPDNSSPRQKKDDNIIEASFTRKE